MRESGGGGKFSRLTRAHIERTLTYQVLMVADVADLLGLSVRTLQRGLANERTSFSALLDDCRRARALEHHAEAHVSVRTLSKELGYSQSSCLSRAMRRWRQP